MLKAVDIREAIAALPVLRDRRPQTQEAEAAAAFAVLADTGRYSVFAGSFEGESAWERHPNGDELVQVVAGGTRLTVLAPEGESVLDMQAGMVTIVPQGCWHKFHAPGGVSVLTMTPPPTEHSTAEKPTQG